MKILLLVMITVYSLSSFAFISNDSFRSELKKMTLKGHTPGHSYKSARKMILQNIHIKRDRKGYFVNDVYCQMDFRNGVSPTTMPDHQKINIEHTWPRSRFEQSKGSTAFKVREADLHHLYPTDSRANSARGNHNFSEFPKKNEIERCKASRKGIISETSAYGFEPPVEHKGNVARALFYFAVRYDIQIPAYEEFYLRQWNLIDPPDDEEVKRNDGIEKLQGNRNPFIDDPALAELIQNF